MSGRRTPAAVVTEDCTSKSTRSSSPAASTTFRSASHPRHRACCSTTGRCERVGRARRRSSDSAADRSWADRAPYCSLRACSSSAIFVRMVSSVCATGLSAARTFDYRPGSGGVGSVHALHEVLELGAAAFEGVDLTSVLRVLASRRSSASERTESSCARSASAVARRSGGVHAGARAARVTRRRPRRRRCPRTSPMTKARICMTQPWQCPPTPRLQAGPCEEQGPCNDIRPNAVYSRDRPPKKPHGRSARRMTNEAPHVHDVITMAVSRSTSTRSRPARSRTSPPSRSPSAARHERRHRCRTARSRRRGDHPHGQRPVRPLHIARTLPEFGVANDFVETVEGLNTPSRSARSSRRRLPAVLLPGPKAPDLMITTKSLPLHAIERTRVFWTTVTASARSRAAAHTTPRTRPQRIDQQHEAPHRPGPRLPRGVLAERCRGDARGRRRPRARDRRRRQPRGVRGRRGGRPTRCGPPTPCSSAASRSRSSSRDRRACSRRPATRSSSSARTPSTW